MSIPRPDLIYVVQVKGWRPVFEWVSETPKLIENIDILKYQVYIVQCLFGRASRSLKNKKPLKKIHSLFFSELIVISHCFIRSIPNVF